MSRPTSFSANSEPTNRSTRGVLDVRRASTRDVLPLMTRKPITTRLARGADADTIAAIYNEGINDGMATFETEPRTAAEIAALLAGKHDRYPTIVAERDGRIVGWASASPYRSRPAYEEEERDGGEIQERNAFVVRGQQPGFDPVVDVQIVDARFEGRL